MTLISKLEVSRTREYHAFLKRLNKNLRLRESGKVSYFEEWAKYLHCHLKE